MRARCRCGRVDGAVSMRHARRFMRVFDLLGVRVSSVRVSRGEGVARAVATDIAIGSLASEKMPKGETPPSEKMAKWGLDKSPQNDKTRA